MPSPYKLTIHQWACNLDLSIGSAKLAQMAVTSADMMHELSRFLRERVVD